MIDVNFVNRPGYNVNSLGYRTDEFNSIDWSKSYIIQGCSAVFGLGTLEDDKITSYYLSKMLGSPVINLGVPGSGMELQYTNTIELLESGIKPKGVFIIYPGMDRYTLFNDREREHIGPWSDESKLKWMLNNNSRQHNLNLVRGYRLIWKLAGVEVFEWSHHRANKDFCNNVIEWDKFLDLGNDGQHWGPITSQAVARILFDQFEERRSKAVV